MILNLIFCVGIMIEAGESSGGQTPRGGPATWGLVVGVGRGVRIHNKNLKCDKMY
jgi:hypothetical protein